MSAVLSMAADYAYYAQNSDSANLVDLENIFKAGTLAAAQYATNMPFLQGVSELTKLLVILTECLKVLGNALENL